MTTWKLRAEPNDIYSRRKASVDAKVSEICSQHASPLHHRRLSRRRSCAGNLDAERAAVIAYWRV